MPTSIIIATTGRPDIVCDCLTVIGRQHLGPIEIIVSCVADTDVGDHPSGLKLKIVKGPPGLTRQRNTGLRNVSPDADIVAFFDDDFIPDPGWIDAVETYFALHDDVAGLTGTMIADGINGPGLSGERALQLIEENKYVVALDVRADYSPYGCNMAFRRSAIRAESFDERLVLYGWQEDRDFGARVAKHGRLMKIGAARGVHLGVKKARVSGVRLGYSQVINPFYLRKKGTMTTAAALTHAGKNVLANSLRSLRPEPYIDRRGRLRGNAIAMRDLARGRLTPERAAAL